MKVDYGRAEKLKKKLNIRFYGQSWLMSLEIKSDDKLGHYISVNKRPLYTAPEIEGEEDGIVIRVESKDPGVPREDCSQF